ncbi:MAG TPA: SMP-30/gluconolactonase/LRE family protein [Burkholderiales bacterium]|nr:SMP-30/gluconolactonase/LRE family protein [Burkholderiales bacterium]
MDIEVDMKAPGAERITGARPAIDVIAENVIFGEGPVWDRRDKVFFFTDIIGDTIWKWRPDGTREVVLKPSVKANGTTLDREGRLVVAGWGGRTVFRFERDGSIKTLATHWQGKKLNSPNDIVVKSDGAIYFTDPPGGMLNVGMVGTDLQKYLDVQPVFRIGTDGALSIATDDFVYPNGLCFSPDEKLLYVNCSRERLIRVYDVKPDGSLGKGRLFHQYTGTERGVPDGMKCDVEGNVYCTGPGGIFVHDPSGQVLARIKVPGHPTNFAFGDDDWKTLYVTCIGNVVRMRLNVPGVASW